MKKIIIITLICLVFLSACKKDDYGEGKGPSTFPQLKGTYVEQGSNIFRSIYTFYDNDVLFIRDQIKNIKETEWRTQSSGNLQWKIVDNLFYTRSWKHNISSGNVQTGEWDSGKSFKYIDPDSFELDGRTYLKDDSYPEF